MEKVIPQSAKELPQSRWIDLSQGWYAGLRYDGFVLFAHTNGLPPGDDRSNASILQLTPGNWKKLVIVLDDLMKGGG